MRNCLHVEEYLEPGIELLIRDEAPEVLQLVQRDGIKPLTSPSSKSIE